MHTVSDGNPAKLYSMQQRWIFMYAARRQQGFCLCRVDRMHLYIQGSHSPATEVGAAVELAEGSWRYLPRSPRGSCTCVSMLSAVPTDRRYRVVCAMRPNTTKDKVAAADGPAPDRHVDQLPANISRKLHVLHATQTRSTPVLRRSRATAGGVSCGAAQWCSRTGMSSKTTMMSCKDFCGRRRLPCR